MGSSPGACRIDIQTRPSAKTENKWFVGINYGCKAVRAWELTVRVEHFTGEFHFWRTERVVGREDQFSWKHSTLETCALWAAEILKRMIRVKIFEGNIIKGVHDHL